MNEQPIGDPSTNLPAGSLSTPAGEGAPPPPLSIEAAVPASGDGAHRADLADFGAQPVPKFDKSGSRQAVAFAIAVAGWLVPGLGHALLKMWGRALAVFITVGVLVIIGAGMRGNIFDSSGMDAFDRLGYFADLGTGCFYFLARAIERLGADVSHANGDYGTRFLATAGILNLLSALHAFEAARGHKA
jgi:hypothetical protein